MSPPPGNDEKRAVQTYMYVGLMGGGGCQGQITEEPIRFQPVVLSWLKQRIDDREVLGLNPVSAASELWKQHLPHFASDCQPSIFRKSLLFKKLHLGAMAIKKVTSPTQAVVSRYPVVDSA